MCIPVAPQRVFEALDTDAGRAAFWAESAIEHDGMITFCFINGLRHESRILERRPATRWSIEYFGGAATFVLAAAGPGTDVMLTHEGIAAADWQDVHAGWLNVLFPLKAYLAFGVDLRNHDPARTWERGYADQ
jgi:hypothetical protein